MGEPIFDTEQKVEELARLVAEGKTQAQIAAHFGCHANTIAKYIHDIPGLNYNVSFSIDGRRPWGSGKSAKSKYEHIINEKTSPGMMYADYLRLSGQRVSNYSLTRDDLLINVNDDEAEQEARRLRQKHWNKGLFNKKQGVDNLGNTANGREGV